VPGRVSKTMEIISHRTGKKNDGLMEFNEKYFIVAQKNCMNRTYSFFQEEKKVNVQDLQQ
jgi:hypothetical protein